MINSHRRKVSVSQTHSCWRSPSRSMQEDLSAMLTWGRQVGRENWRGKRRRMLHPSPTISSRWRPKYWVLELHPAARRCMPQVRTKIHAVGACEFILLHGVWAGRRMVRSDTSGQNSLLKYGINKVCPCQMGHSLLYSLGKMSTFVKHPKCLRVLPSALLDFSAALAFLWDIMGLTSLLVGDISYAK